MQIATIDEIKEVTMAKKITYLMIILIVVGSLSAQDIELTGEVIKTQEIPAQSDINIIQAEIKTRNQEMVMAQLGPVWMFGTEPKSGDEIMVKGKYNDERQLMVREMLCNNIRYQVRGEDYQPLWLRTRLQTQTHIYNPQDETRVKGRISELYVDEPSAMMEAMVKSENGEIVRVRLAPEWHLQNRLRVGDELELRGSEVKSDGQTMILAREMRNLRTRQEITLRNAQGFPDWCGKGKCANKQQGRPCCQDQESRGRGKNRP